MSRDTYGSIHANDNSRVHLGDVNYYGNQERLRYVPGAAFNAYGLDHHSCHPATRQEILDEIKKWATEGPTSKSIFWLNGMAGTGKSTIAYTVAEWLSNQDNLNHANLGASFFFKRGEKDRASAELFFPTIVRQLSHKIRGLAIHIDDAIKADPDICNKALGEQCDKLLVRPLRKLGDELVLPRYVIVVDALDECQKQEDIRTLLQLWALLSQMPNLCIRWFLTSRPELPIQLGFSRISTDARKDIILHEVPRQEIERDISVFLADVFSQVRCDYNVEPLSGVALADDWPGADVLNELTQMAVPLFIIAATISRFVRDFDFDPQEQLEVILNSRKIGQLTNIGQTYLPVLVRAFASPSNTTIQKQHYHEFRLIVGTIITIAEAISPSDLSALLKLSPKTVNLRLRSFSSVLHLPRQVNVPVRLLHLSFAEFLSSEEIQDQPFYINPTATHAMLLSKCLELLSQPSPVGLSEDMCHLSHPGQSRQSLASANIRERLSPAVQYACRYWTYHAQNSKTQILDGGQVHEFLCKHFLHWLEALSLLGCVHDAAVYIKTLQTLLPATDTSHIAAFLEDAREFILANRYIVSDAPLQLYCSAIAFAPQTSIVKKIHGLIPDWITQNPTMPEMWKSEVQLLEGHTSGVMMVKFSSNGLWLVSASNDQTLRLWDIGAGKEIQRFESCRNGVKAIAFLPGDLQLASVFGDGTIILWNVRTAQEIHRTEGLPGFVEPVTFSFDGLSIVSSSIDRTLRLWNTRTGEEMNRFEGHTKQVNAVAFSPDKSMLASASMDQTVRLWNVQTAQEIHKIHNDRLVLAVALSSDGLHLALASFGGTLWMYDLSTSEVVWFSDVDDSVATSMTFSPDNLHLASATEKSKVRIWTTKSGRERYELRGHTSYINNMTFSPNSTLLALASSDEIIRIWNLTKPAENYSRPQWNDRTVSECCFSPDNLHFVICFDSKMELWNIQAGTKVQDLEEHSSTISFLEFSPDSSLFASASGWEHDVWLWNTTTGREVYKLEIPDDYEIMTMKFSPNSRLFAVSSYPGMIQIWDTKTGYELLKQQEHSNVSVAIALSFDGSLLASVSRSEARLIRLLNTRTGQWIAKLMIDDLCDYIVAMAFSPDGSQLALTSRCGEVELWSVSTRRQIQKLENYPISKINSMSFTEDGYTLRINERYMSINEALVDGRSTEWKSNTNYALDNDWVKFHDTRLLWLPPEYRRHSSSTIRGNVLVLVGRGLVTFLRLNYSG